MQEGRKVASARVVFQDVPTEDEGGNPMTCAAPMRQDEDGGSLDGKGPFFQPLSPQKPSASLDV